MGAHRDTIQLAGHYSGPLFSLLNETHSVCLLKLRSSRKTVAGMAEFSTTKEHIIAMLIGEIGDPDNLIEQN